MTGMFLSEARLVGMGEIKIVYVQKGGGGGGGCLLICFSRGFDRTDTIEVGLQFDGFALSPDMYTGITLAVLKA